MISKTKKIESYAKDVQQWVDARVGELEQTHGAPLPQHLEEPFSVIEAQMGVAIAAMTLVREALEDTTLSPDALWSVATLIGSVMHDGAAEAAGSLQGRFVDLETGRGYDLDALRQVLPDLT